MISNDKYSNLISRLRTCQELADKGLLYIPSILCLEAADAIEELNYKYQKVLSEKGNMTDIPPHGRLIDELEVNSHFDNGIKTISKLPLPNDFVELYKQLVTEVKEEIGKCHTIIPASKEAEY